MNHYFENVPGQGNVAVSRHAQARCVEEGISEEMFAKVLLKPVEPDMPEGNEIVWRQSYGIRIVIIINPTPNRGARLVKTVYRIKAQEKAR